VPQLLRHLRSACARNKCLQALKSVGNINATYTELFSLTRADFTVVLHSDVKVITL
jgi:hypothetical protein